MKISDRPATKPRPAVATGSDDETLPAATTPGPTATAGCPARAPRYARYAGTRGRTHGDTKETRPARKAIAGLMPSRVGMPPIEAAARSPVGQAPRWRPGPAAKPVRAGRGPSPRIRANELPARRPRPCGR